MRRAMVCFVYPPPSLFLKFELLQWATASAVRFLFCPATLPVLLGAIAASEHGLHVTFDHRSRVIMRNSHRYCPRYVR